MVIEWSGGGGVDEGGVDAGAEDVGAIFGGGEGRGRGEVAGEGGRGKEEGLEYGRR